MKKLTVSWFSAGVSSAVATKLLTDQIDKIIYTHIDDQHPDTMRFVRDCEAWFGKPVEILQSPYKSVEAVCRALRFINGPHGSCCTKILKKRTRKEWECDHEDEDLTYVWGIDLAEQHRCERIVESMPEQKHRFPLVEQGITKEYAHRILAASGIKRPAMYDLAFPNNNCIGCVKGGMGYWNLIRVQFPEVFASRAALEREVGHSCINGVYLDELDPKAGRNSPTIDEECGIFCELMALQ